MTVRVLMTSDAVGGVWTYAMQLAAALENRVRFLLAVTGEAPSGEQIGEASRIKGLQLRHRPYQLEWAENPWSDVAATGSWLRDLEQDFRPDVIHCNGYSYASAGFETPTLVVAHSCVTSWWRSVHRTDPPPAWNRYRRNVERGLRSAEAVVAPTAAMLDALRSAYVFETDALVIPNGIASREAPAGRSRRPMILGAGRLWDEAKNVRTLISAAAGLPWEVVIAGDAGKLAASDGVKLTGRIPHAEILALMEAAAIYAHPALYEPFGLAPLEAARAGCALVLSDIPSLREVWDGVAVFVDPRAPEAWNAALFDLIADPRRQAALGAAAAKHAKRFDARRMSERYLQLYLDLRNPGGPKRSSSIGKESYRSHEDRSVLSLADL